VGHGRVGTDNTENTTAGISSGSESAPTDSVDAGVGGTQRGGAKRRGDCEEWDVKESDCEQYGGKRRRCEELVNEHVREKIKRYKTMTHKGEGKIGEQLLAQVHERSWRRARKRERQEEESATKGKVKKKRTAQRKTETSRYSARTLTVWQRMLAECIT
jgi:hypothetical protein